VLVDYMRVSTSEQNLVLQRDRSWRRFTPKSHTEDAEGSAPLTWRLETAWERVAWPVADQAAHFQKLNYAASAPSC